jgi:sugar lactone lactonase YvrE
MRSALTLCLWLFVAATADAGLELLVELPADTPPGNIAVGPDGRIFLSVHEFYGHATKIVELRPDGTTRPYPTSSWASSPKDSVEGLHGVLGLNVDRRGILWMLDGAGEKHTARLVAWDTRNERLHRIIYLGYPATNEQSFVNDLAIDNEHNAVYITDVATPETSALIVVDLNTGQIRRVLEGSQFTSPENVDINVAGTVVTLGGNPARIGANPITIDPTNTWVYFGAMNGTSLYRVKTTDLLNNALTREQLAERIERYGDKPVSDGITVDNSGNVYVTAINDNAIGVIGADGQYKILYQGEHISWPDGFAVGPDNQIYVTINELHLSPVLNSGTNGSTGKFAVYRFNSTAPALPGR